MKGSATKPKNSKCFRQQLKNVCSVPTADRKVTVKRLRALGFDTDQASSGPEAVQILENDASIDLVLSDVVMDGAKSGFDVAQWVRKHCPPCKLFLTSGFNEQMAEESNVNTENLRVLQKPYSLTELQQAVSDALE